MRSASGSDDCRGGRLLVALVPVDRAVEHQPQLHPWCVGDDLGRLVGEIPRRDERLRPAVVEDVGQLAAREARRGGREDQARVAATPEHFEIAVVVLHAQRDVVAGLEAGRPQHLAQAVGGGVQFGERLREATAGHDDGRLVTEGVNECAREHARESTIPSWCGPGRCHGSDRSVHVTRRTLRCRARTRSDRADDVGGPATRSRRRAVARRSRRAGGLVPRR